MDHTKIGIKRGNSYRENEQISGKKGTNEHTVAELIRCDNLRCIAQSDVNKYM